MHYPSGAAQAVFIRLIPPVTVRVALMEAEIRVIQRVALPSKSRLLGSWPSPPRGPSSGNWLGPPRKLALCQAERMPGDKQD